LRLREVFGGPLQDSYDQLANTSRLRRYSHHILLRKAALACSFETSVAGGDGFAIGVGAVRQPAPPIDSIDSSRAAFEAARRWASRLRILDQALLEHTKPWASQFKERSIALYIVRSDDTMPIEQSSLEFVFIDRLVDGVPVEGRIVNVDSELRIIYSMPMCKRAIGGMGTRMGTMLLIPIIKNIGTGMRRTPPALRDPMLEHPMIVRSSFCAFLSSAAWADADLHGFGGDQV
jgi:hypothetical protein